MTEDILFDNLYVGHSVEDAKALAAETFEVKKPLETAAEKPETSDEEEETETPAFKDDPINFIRQKVLTFVDAAKLDPVAAFKTQPETGAALVGALLTFLGMLSVLLGGSQKPVVTKVSCVHYNSVQMAYSSCSLRRRPMPPPPTTRKRPRLHPWPLPEMPRRMTVA